MKYTGNKLNEISFPLGGIGSGSIGLAGNGSLVDWEIYNIPNKNSTNYYTHFALRAFDGDQIVDARVLKGRERRDFCGKHARNFGSGIYTDTLEGFPHFEECTFEGEFPIANIDFADSHFPARVRLTAFNPFIPLDDFNSSLPAAFFEITIENTSDKPLKYETAFSVANPFYRSVNTKQNGGVLLTGKEKTCNNLCALTDSKDVKITAQWYRGWRNNMYRDNVRTFWNEFSGGAPISERDYGNDGGNDVCTIGAALELSSGEKKSVRFVLSWYIPEYRNYWFKCLYENGQDKTWNNYYATKFDSSLDVARYCLENYSELYKKTDRFREILYRSSLDDCFKEAIASGISVLKTAVVLRLEDGSFYGWEGIHEHHGSCDGTCQHVWNYAYALCYLFPSLERSIRDMWKSYGTLDSGETVMRIALPLGRPEFVNLFTGDGKKGNPCADGHFGEIIKSYREWKISGDDEWLKERWEHLKRVLSFAWSDENTCRWDEDCSGVLKGAQHHTLDIEMFGANGWLQGFYMCAIRAMADMAQYLGDTEEKALCDRLFENGYKYTAEKLFNGRWFVQEFDLFSDYVYDKYNCRTIFENAETGQVKHQLGHGCFIDQLCGQWHALLCGCGDVFDIEQIKSTLLSIYDNNFHASMKDMANPWRIFAAEDEGGTLMCSYPEGVFKPSNPIPYGEEVMTGFEYAFAGLLIAYGFYDKAVTVVKAVRDRYDGERRNPWNDLECGNNYSRSMASFAFLPLLTGFVADLPRGKIVLSPKVECRPLRTLVSVDSGWGELEISDKAVSIALEDGDLSLEVVEMPMARSCVGVSVDGLDVPFRIVGDEVRFERRKIEKCITVSFK